MATPGALVVDRRRGAPAAPSSRARPRSRARSARSLKAVEGDDAVARAPRRPPAPLRSGVFARSRSPVNGGRVPEVGQRLDHVRRRPRARGRGRAPAQASVVRAARDRRAPRRGPEAPARALARAAGSALYVERGGDAVAGLPRHDRGRSRTPSAHRQVGRRRGDGRARRGDCRARYRAWRARRPGRPLRAARDRRTRPARGSDRRAGPGSASSRCCAAYSRIVSSIA